MSELIVAAIVGGVILLLWLRRERQLRREAEQDQLRREAFSREQEGLRLRREALIEKYGSIQITNAILAGKIWQGMSTEQLSDAWGRPADVDQKVFKDTTRETWKYGEIGKNRYSHRVFVENCSVVGWEYK